VAVKQAINLSLPQFIPFDQNDAQELFMKLVPLLHRGIDSLFSPRKLTFIFLIPRVGGLTPSITISLYFFFIVPGKSFLCILVECPFVFSPISNPP
jgi:hypothetical protein